MHISALIIVDWVPIGNTHLLARCSAARFTRGGGGKADCFAASSDFETDSAFATASIGLALLALRSELALLELPEPESLGLAPSLQAYV